MIIDKGNTEQMLDVMIEDGDVTDDDVFEDGGDGTCFGIGIVREEKIEVRRLWQNSRIVKLIG